MTSKQNVFVENNVLHFQKDCVFVKVKALILNLENENLEEHSEKELCVCFMSETKEGSFLNETYVNVLASFKTDFKKGKLNYIDFFNLFLKVQKAYKEDLISVDVFNEFDDFRNEVKSLKTIESSFKHVLLANAIIFSGADKLTFHNSNYDTFTEILSNNTYSDLGSRNFYVDAPPWGSWLENSVITKYSSFFVKEVKKLLKTNFMYSDKNANLWEAGGLTYLNMVKLTHAMKDKESYDNFLSSWLSTRSELNDIYEGRFKLLKIFQAAFKALMDNEDKLKDVLLIASYELYASFTPRKGYFQGDASELKDLLSYELFVKACIEYDFFVKDDFIFLKVPEHLAAYLMRFPVFPANVGLDMTSKGYVDILDENPNNEISDLPKILETAFVLNNNAFKFLYGKPEELEKLREDFQTAKNLETS